MKALTLSLWGLAGIVLAFLFLKSQAWSVMRISPEHRGRSLWLVIGGAVLRWLIIGGALYLALTESILAMLVLFISFMVARMLFLFLWQASTRQKPFRAHHVKD